MVAVHAGIENWSLCKKHYKSSILFDVLQSFFFWGVFMICCDAGRVFLSGVHDTRMGRKCLLP